jgi:hypothetical protein
MNGYGHGRNAGVDQLSLDLLGAISNFSTEPNLGQVNRTMRDVHWMRRYGPHPGHYIVTEANIDDIIAEFERGNIPQPPVVHFTIPSLPPGLREKMKSLYIQTAKFNYRVGRSGIVGGVHALDITLSETDLQGEDPADIIAATISDIEYQHTSATGLERFTPIAVQKLKLNCSSLSLGPTGCRRAFDHLTSFAPRLYGGIAASDFPGLHTVSLELSNNGINDDGCEALWNGINDGVTEDQPYRGPIGGSQLKTLYLGLKNNQIGSAGALYLAKFKRLQKMVSLHIDLEDNQIGDYGALWLSEDEPDDDFNDSRFAGQNLHTFVLNCKNNGIRDGGVTGFTTCSYGTYMRWSGGVYRTGYLRDLHLNLDGNQITVQGLRDIARWRNSLDTTEVGLNNLHIHAVNNPGSMLFRSENMRERG